MAMTQVENQVQDQMIVQMETEVELQAIQILLQMKMIVIQRK